MPSDRTMKDIPVEHEFTFYGQPARLLVELTTDRGHTIHVPIGDLAKFESDSGRYYSEIRVPIRGEILRRVGDAADDAAMAGL